MAMHNDVNFNFKQVFDVSVKYLAGFENVIHGELLPCKYHQP